MPPQSPLRFAPRAGATSRRDRALAACLAGARALHAGRTDVALRHYAAGVVLAPDDADVAALHGVALRSALRLGDAQRELIRAISLDQSRADSYEQLAQTYRMAGDRAQAAQAFLAAASLRPTNAMAWRDAAESLRLAGRLSDGLDAARRAAQLAPTDASIVNTTALLLYRAGQLDAALALCQQTSGDVRDDVHLVLTRAMLLRTIEQYDEGWALYERRLELPDLAQRPHAPSTPCWTGDALSGRRILVRAEQGLGDQVQFVRWACLLRSCGAGRVIVQTAPALARLLQTAPQLDAVVGTDVPLPPHDVHVNLLSLPHLLRTGNDMQTALVPYLAPPGVAPGIAVAMPPKPLRTLRIGLVWGGTPQHADDATRSMTLGTLDSVLRRRDVQVVVLQQGAVRAQLDALTPGQRDGFIDAAPACADMGETAHVMTRCDVILSVDTSVVHVAGALGIPAWLMVAEPAEWRWGRQRTDSLFYPSVRVFRQQRGGDWSPVIADLHHAITQWLQDRAS